MKVCLITTLSIDIDTDKCGTIIATNNLPQWDVLDTYIFPFVINENE